MYLHIKLVSVWTLCVCICVCVLVHNCCMCVQSMCDCKKRVQEEMCNNFPAWSSVALARCSRARRVMINTHTNTHWHTWIKARIVNSPEKPTTNWLCNAKRKRQVLLPRNFKGPRWDAHLLWEIFYLDAMQQWHHSSTITYLGNPTFGILFPFYSNLLVWPHSLSIQSLLVCFRINFSTVFFFF